MLKLHENDANERWKLAEKAKKKIPIYEERNNDTVKVPFLGVASNKQRYLKFRKLNGVDWSYIEVVD